MCHQDHSVKNPFILVAELEIGVVRNCLMLSLWFYLPASCSEGFSGGRGDSQRPVCLLLDLTTVESRSLNLNSHFPLDPWQSVTSYNHIQTSHRPVRFYEIPQHCVCWVLVSGSECLLHLGLVLPELYQLNQVCYTFSSVQFLTM